MNRIIKIKKGLDIPLEGKASSEISIDDSTQLFGVVPDDFPGYTWKTAVKEGDTVEAGSPLLYAKEDERLRLVSPVSGHVQEIHRGERRKIEYVSVKREQAVDPQNNAMYTGSKDSHLEILLESGLFAMIRQRPFDIVARIDQVPRDIFVTAFDTAPLAPEMMRAEMSEPLEAGLKVLSELTDGKVYLSIPKGLEIKSEYAEVIEFEGPHPAGNVGTQIAAIKPVNKGEVVWTTDAATVSRIGILFSRNELDFSTHVALTGDEISNPHIVKTRIGASIASLLEGELKNTDKKVRIISGNVLTGEKVTKKEFLRYPYRQITVIDEGDDADEFMGWASVNPNKYSVKRSFPAFLRGLSKPFKFDARIKGGHRAMIMSGEYEKVFPMDIYPEYLLKAIMAKDIEKMEQLGIYEVAPEDFALPEFVDTSKQELQKLVRNGLDYLRKETT